MLVEVLPEVARGVAHLAQRPREYHVVLEVVVSPHVHAAQGVGVAVVLGPRVLDVVEVAAREELRTRGAADGGVRVEPIEGRAAGAERLHREGHGLHAVVHEVLVIRQDKDDVRERFGGARSGIRGRGGGEQ